MTYINPENSPEGDPESESEGVHADLERAIERQEYEGGIESICDVLQAVAPASCEYWYEVACELHRREKFYDSLDCWREAEKYLAKSEEDPRYWYQDMVRTLINSSDQTGDSYFRQQALEACERLIVVEASEEALNYKLELLLDLHADRDEVLSLLERIFDEGYEPGLEVDPDRLGIENVDCIESFSDLAECYLWLDQPAEALRIWSKVIAKNKIEATDKLCSAIYMLNWYADSKGFDDGSFLPGEFGRIDG